MKVNIKPLSVNAAWQGKRFKTKLYKQYEKDLFLILPAKIKIPEGKLAFYIKFGFSNSGSDNDNPLKPLQDVLQKKYNFNDNRIYRTIIEKTIVPKGQEFIDFYFETFIC